MHEFKAYVREIDQTRCNFDLIFIDGRARIDCIAHSVNRVASGGVIILDNSERVQYNDGVLLLKDFDRVDYYGKGDGGSWQTSFFTAK